MLSQSDIDDLEGMIDRFSLSEVLQALSGICDEKASHLESNWQDKNAAKCWTRDGAKITKLAGKLEN